MENKDKQSLAIYATNLAGSYIPRIGSLFNPVGAIVFGGIDVAKRFYDKVDNPYVRMVEALGALAYSVSAASNILHSLGGDMHSLGRGVLDASMAYQLWANEGVLNNVKSGQTKEDIKKIKNDLESILEGGKK